MVTFFLRKSHCAKETSEFFWQLPETVTLSQIPGIDKTIESARAARPTQPRGMNNAGKIRQMRNASQMLTHFVSGADATITAVTISAVCNARLSFRLQPVRLLLDFILGEIVTDGGEIAIVRVGSLSSSQLDSLIRELHGA